MAATEQSPQSQWYESTLLWGALGLAFAILLTVVAAMARDLRWLLIVAWPFLVLAVWAAFRRIKHRGRWGLIIGVSLLLGMGILWLHEVLRLPAEQATQGSGTTVLLPVFTEAKADYGNLKQRAVDLSRDLRVYVALREGARRELLK